MVLPNAPQRPVTSGFTGTGFGFVETLGLELLAGRDFSAEYPGDWFRKDAQGIGHASVVITQSMSRSAGFATPHDAIGQKLRLDIYGTQLDPEVNIVGVVANVKVGSVRSEHRPILFVCGFSWVRSASIVLNLTNADSAQVRAQAAQLLRDRFGIDPGVADMRLTEEQYAAIYRHESGQANLVRVFATLAIFLSCVGSVGLAAFSAQRRRREFAIRRIQGASRLRLLNLLVNEYMVLICLSALLAFPVAYVSLGRWLSEFGSRIEQTPVHYVLAIVLLCGVTWLAISGVALRAARIRPAEALRHD